jgi:hypothetical protein
MIELGVFSLTELTGEIPPSDRIRDVIDYGAQYLSPVADPPHQPVWKTG